MGAFLCRPNRANSSWEDNKSLANLRNHEPQTTMISGKGIPNVSSQLPNNPQQNYFEYDDIAFDSRFESGNLAQVERVSANEFNLWIAPDGYKTNYPTRNQVWFYFQVEVAPFTNPSRVRSVYFHIKNLNLSQRENFLEGMVPVFRSSLTNNTWEYLPYPLRQVKRNNDCVSFTIQYNFMSADLIAYFAYSFPYTHTDLTEFVSRMEQQFAGSSKMRIQRETIALSLEQRPIELITITGADSVINDDKALDLLRIENSATSADSHSLNSAILGKIDYNRKYVLITCRARAADTSTSYVLEGFIKTLLSPELIYSRSAWDDFVFLIVPMVNPDGVVRGYTRCDSQGKDLSRNYGKHLNKDKFPGMCAIRTILKELKEAGKELYMYWDLEATTVRDGVSIEGVLTDNQLKDREASTLARLFELYSRHFVLHECRLEDPAGLLRSRNLSAECLVDPMVSKLVKDMLQLDDHLEDNQGGMYKRSLPILSAGATPKTNERITARNFVANTSKICLAFTLKSNLYKGKKRVEQRSFEDLDLFLEAEENPTRGELRYLLLPSHHREVGNSLLQVILEMGDSHPVSILSQTCFQNLDKLKNFAQTLLIKNDLRNTIM